MYKSVAIMAAGASAAVIPNEFIVEMQSGASAKSTYGLLQSAGIKKEDMIGEWNIDNGAFVGFAFRGSENQRLMFADDVNVKSVTPNEEVFALDCGSESPSSWGLASVSNAAPYRAGSNHEYSLAGGAGVVSYVLDTGVRYTHNDFGGRAELGADFTGEGGGDGNGHGTHVAGTMGGTRFGVAKATTLVDVKVLGRSGGGSFAGVLNGVNWAASDCVSRNRGVCVANMSLGGQGSQTAMENAIRAASNTASNGVAFVLASGNSNANACNFTPARAGGPNSPVLTVNSFTTGNSRSNFSNFGACTDIFAPGSSITSAWFNSDSATNTISGTSMASPHVAGAAAVMAGEGRFTSPGQLKDAMMANAQSGQISNAGTNSPNMRLFEPCA